MSYGGMIACVTTRFSSMGRLLGFDCFGGKAGVSKSLEGTGHV